MPQVRILSLGPNSEALSNRQSLACYHYKIISDALNVHTNNSEILRNSLYIRNVNMETVIILHAGNVETKALYIGL